MEYHPIDGHQGTHRTSNKRSKTGNRGTRTSFLLFVPMKHETKQFNKPEEVLLLAVQVVVSMIAFLLRG
jgi:hypothetical protein